MTLGITHLPTSAKVNAASNNIPVAFSTAAGSRLLSGLLPGLYKHLSIVNETLVQISFLNQNSATAPSASSSNRVFIPAGAGIIMDNFRVQDAIFIQSEGSAITIGTVEVTVW